MESLIILVLCVILLLILVVFYIKDKQSDEKFARFDQVLTDNMQEAFLLKKEIEKIKELINDMEIGDLSVHIDAEIDAKLMPIIKNLQAIQDLINKH